MSSDISVQQSPIKLSKEVYQIIYQLNSRHSLGIVLDAGLDGIQQTSDDRAVRKLLQFLYKNNRRLMDQTIREFDRQAIETCSGWVFKSRADRDVLPHRNQRLPKGEHNQEQELSESQILALRSLLLSLLQGAKSECLLNTGRSDGVQSLPVRPLSQTTQRTSNTNLSQMASPVSSRITGSSLDDDLRTFNLEAIEELLRNGDAALSTPDQKPREAPLDVDMADTEDTYSTPPQSPSEIRIGRGRTATNTSHTTVTRKRVSPEVNSYERSRKRSMQHIEARIPSSSVRTDAQTLSESFTTCVTSVPSTLRTTNSNNSFKTNVTSTSFEGVQSLPNGDTMPALSEPTVIESELDLHQLSPVKAEQPMLFAELEGEPLYPKLGHLRNKTSSVSSLESQLYDESPLSFKRNKAASNLPLRIRYEVTRLSLHYSIPPENFYEHLNTCDELRFKEYEYLWSSLIGYAHQYPGTAAAAAVIPEKSQATAWQAAGEKYDGVSFRADLQFTGSATGPFFNLRLLPLVLERSYRLARHFGADRFFVFNVPSLEAKNLPKATPCGAELAGEAIIGWLVGGTHYLLGREWRAFYVKPKAKQTKPSKESSSQWRVYLFAVNGYGFVQPWALSSGHHKVMPIEDMVKWFLPWEENLDAPALKLFSRLQLAVSPTIPTIVFRRTQIIRCDDTRSGTEGRRLLDIKRHDEKLAGLEADCRGNVMSDGCARISQQAAKIVAERYGILDHVPSAFQARIGGAKGVWVVDTAGEVLNGDDIWIEIADSQLKFEGPNNDWIHPDVQPDDHRLTFEVHKPPLSLKSAVLNFQLIPILIDRGVDPNIFSNRLADDLKEKSERLKASMKTGLSLRVLSQEINPVSNSRIAEGSILKAGGVPNSITEQINFLTEAGFEPQNNKFLRDACRTDIGEYCKRVEEQARIEIGQSTYALMVPDFMGVLEEDEVHFGFSSNFTDSKSGFSDTMVNDCDVLVARIPAALPSDIHKVKAVFHRELAKLKDVIVFPTKGKSSLAEKLSGGDFDGDIAWVCWDSQVVERFVNFDLKRTPPPEFYGIAKDSTRIGDMVGDPDFFTHWLRKSFLFNMRPSFMGICSSYHENFCYELFKHRRSGSMGDPRAVEIGQLLGHLVDTAKNGYIFRQQEWDSYRTRNRLPRSVPKPAYKQDLANPSPHILDQLVLVVAKKLRQSTLSDFEELFKDLPELDADLLQVIKTEEKAAQYDEDLRNVLSALKKQIDILVEDWKIGNQQVKREKMSWTAFADQIRAKFLAIQPWPEALAPKSPKSSLVRRWVDDFNDPERVTSTSRSWSWIKASALYKCYRNKLPWYAAGEELAAIKAVTKSGRPPSVTSEMHHFMKLDGKMVERNQKKQAGRTLGEREVDILELDADEYMSQGYAEAFEALSWAE